MVSSIAKRLAVSRFVEANEALVDGAPRPSNTSIPKFVRWTAYSFGHGEVAAAAEDRQPVDEQPLPVVEQVVAPR